MKINDVILLCRKVGIDISVKGVDTIVCDWPNTNSGTASLLGKLIELAQAEERAAIQAVLCAQIDSLIRRKNLALSQQDAGITSMFDSRVWEIDKSLEAIRARGEK